ncbi:hypothetical protein [Methanosarcina sp. Kolksee]|uniref:hypothetical protein n=1 Tax=Methanosarcina sp. Kolksee TaxID=1434099 RepID=UPI000ABA9370|nr:hypothetical protein [Methanosarcina sp. Kolksee]
MSAKIRLPYKYELCECCRQTHVPVTYPRVNGKRLCSSCAATAILTAGRPDLIAQGVV